jgi:hypothetical protein
MTGMEGDRRSTQTQPSASTDPLSEGDAAAVAGRWPQAVAAWQLALTTPSRSDAIERLSWFVTWRSNESPTQAGKRLWPSSAMTALSLAAAAGSVATALVLIADGTGGLWRPILVTGAWVLYSAAAVLSLVYAVRTGPRRRSAAIHWKRHDTALLCAKATTLANNQPDVAVGTSPVLQQGLRSQGSGP